MRKLLLILLLLIPLTSIAQEKKIEAPKTPVISAEQRAEYFKCQNQVTQIQVSLKAAQEELVKAVGEMVKSCGEKYQPSIDQRGDPVCVAKPEPEKKIEKK